MSISPHRGPDAEPRGRLVSTGNLRASTRAFYKWSVFKGALWEVPGRRALLLVTLKATLRYVKEGFGNGVSLSSYRTHEGGLLYWALWRTCIGRLWKWRVSFIGLHKGNLRHVHGRARPLCSLGWKLCLIYFFVMYNLRGLWPHFWPQPSKGFLSGLRQAEPQGYWKNLSKTNPGRYYGCRQKGQRIMGLVVRGLCTSGP
jgi:hypothetical protein